MPADVQSQLIELLPRLRRFAYSLAGSLDEADDVVQSACERALSRLDQFTPGTRLDSWMFQIVRTVWIDKTRYRKRRGFADELVEAEDIGFDARIHEQTEARMDLALIRKEVAKLPEDQRTVLGLVTIDGMSYQEAATTLGVPIGTVMSRLARARRRLAEAISGEAAPAAKKTRAAGPAP